MVMTKRVHKVTSGGRGSAETSLSTTGFDADQSGDSNDDDDDDLRQGDERDRVNHGVRVRLSKLRVRVDRRVGISLEEWKTDGRLPIFFLLLVLLLSDGNM